MTAEVAVRFAAPREGVAPARPAARDFPTVEAAHRLDPDETTVAVELGAWRAGEVDFCWLDAQADALGERGLVPVSACGEPTARRELLTRCQRWIGRRNRWSRAPWFPLLLAYHRSMYDRAKPLERAGHNHALDAWQWSLRLDADAGAALQVAALFHGVEPVPGVTGRARDTLAAAPAPRDVVRRAAELVGAVSAPLPALPAGDGELALLEDCDALSFFSQGSSGFLDHHGAAETVRRIADATRRLSLRGCAYLPSVRLRRDVLALLGGAPAAMTG